MRESSTLAQRRAVLQSKLLDAETRCSQWLADGNVAATSTRADRCYDKSQFWLDRANRIRDEIYTLDAVTSR